MKLGVSYISAHNPDHIERDMAHLAEIGCDEVLFALQENHFRTMTGGVRFGAKIAKAQHLEPYVVVWGFANTFGGGRMSNYLLEDRSLWRIDRQGVPQPYACLNNPHVIDAFGALTKICDDNGYKGMFVDEPTPQECFCGHCQKRFNLKYNMSLKDAQASPEYDAFRIETVAYYTQQVSQRVKQVNPQLRTITCIMPHDRSCWDTVAKIEELDVFGTDPYWLVSRGKMSIEQAVDDAKAVKALCQKIGKESQIWLNCWRIPHGVEEQIYTGGKQLAEAGCDSMYTWSFRGGLGTNEECDNPVEAWAAVAKLYKELSNS
ncbi:hypothetical protein JXJ21_24205 [candidate division KSB1 bacterium]|nr:hypothetical protein [candidate division KSB1 bacterium]